MAYQYALQPGSKIIKDCYEIVQPIGQGGFGITYLAKKIALIENLGDGHESIRPLLEPELMVVKELFYQDYCSRRGESSNIVITDTNKKIEFEKLVKKQIDEGRLLRQCVHKNIVGNIGIFPDNGTAYIVMDYLSGEDLEELLITSGKLSIEKAIEYMIQVAEALTVVHNKNILHLDIKPSNIYIEEIKDEKAPNDIVKKQAVLIDFGASLAYDEHGNVKNSTSKILPAMTLGYATLEQRTIEGLKYKNNTFDTFALAGTFYHCITGKRPIDASVRITGHDSLPLPSIYDLSDYWDAFIAKGLAINHKERIQSAQEFISLLNSKSIYDEYLAKAQQSASVKEFENAITEVINAEKVCGPTKTTQFLKENYQKLLDEQDIEEKFEAYKIQGLAFMEATHFEKAIKQFDKALELKPADTFVLKKRKDCIQSRIEGDLAEINLLIEQEQLTEAKVRIEMLEKEGFSIDVAPTKRRYNMYLQLIELKDIISKTPPAKEIGDPKKREWRILEKRLVYLAVEFADLNISKLKLYIDARLAIKENVGATIIVPGGGGGGQIIDPLKSNSNNKNTEEDPNGTKEQKPWKIIIIGLLCLTVVLLILPNMEGKKGEPDKEIVPSSKDTLFVENDTIMNVDPITQSYFDYMIYTGEVKNAKPHTDSIGIAKYYKSDTLLFTYQGQFKDGKRAGRGKEVYEPLYIAKIEKESNKKTVQLEAIYLNDIPRDSVKQTFTDGSYRTGKLNESRNWINYTEYDKDGKPGVKN